MTSVFRTPGVVLTGAGCFGEIGHAAEGLGRHCLIVTGTAAMREQGFLDEAIQRLGDAGIVSTVCEGVRHDPTVGMVNSLCEVIRLKGCDMVLGLGGGSAIDAAKAAAAFAHSDMPIEAAFDSNEMPDCRMPILAAPSTFGTGTEATMVAVITEPERVIKKGLRTPGMMPRVAVVDPRLGMGMPPWVAAESGLDALTQAIESYVSLHATDLTEALSFHATILLHNGVPRVHADPADLDARSNCANGSLMAGLAFANARLGLVHGLAHPLGARTGVRHGQVCGILLPYVLAYNREAVPVKYALLGEALGGDPVEVILALLRTLGLPTDLRALDLPDAVVRTIAGEALPSGSTQANPRRATLEDVDALLRQAGAGATSDA